MSDDVLVFLQRSGFNVEARDRNSDKLTAWRRSLYFPQLLFDLGLSGHKDERFCSNWRLRIKPCRIGRS